MKNIIYKIALICFLMGGALTYSQSVKGIVYGANETKKEPLDAAVVKWFGTTKGTITEPNGTFELSLTGITNKRLMISYSGYKTDTIDVGEETYIEVILIPNSTTATIDVEDDKKSTHFGNTH
jgi:outer membrane receptor for ferrienterochelin and colicins